VCLMLWVPSLSISAPAFRKCRLTVPYDCGKRPILAGLEKTQSPSAGNSVVCLQAFRVSSVCSPIVPLCSARCFVQHRSWLDAAGAAISVQREMMRHSDVYGSIVTDQFLTAHRKVVSMALSDSKVIPSRASH